MQVQYMYGVAPIKVNFKILMYPQDLIISVLFKYTYRDNSLLILFYQYILK